MDKKQTQKILEQLVQAGENIVTIEMAINTLTIQTTGLLEVFTALKDSTAFYPVSSIDLTK
jgi:hypothetical protein